MSGAEYEYNAAEDRRRVAEARVELFRDPPKLKPAPVAILYGKPRCGKCKAAEEKLRRFGIPYEKRKMEDVVSGKVRDVEALTQYAMDDGALPVLVIKGRGFSYPGAIKFLKGSTKE